MPHKKQRSVTLNKLFDIYLRNSAKMSQTLCEDSA